MKIASVFDPSFREYGEIVPGDYRDILEVLATRPCPENGTMYVASDKDLESVASFPNIVHEFGGDLPLQFGFCSGHNRRMNCLEFHRDSEWNLANEDFILLLARRQDVTDGRLNTALRRRWERVPRPRHLAKRHQRRPRPRSQAASFMGDQQVALCPP